MADTSSITTENNQAVTSEPTRTSHVAFSIWPPTQRTREAVTARLIETLSTPSILSKRYGTMGPEEAKEAANRIEEEAFGAAGNGAGDADGMDILQAYSKEISKRMLNAVKTRSDHQVVDADMADSDEVKVVENEG